MKTNAFNALLMLSMLSIFLSSVSLVYATSFSYKILPVDYIGIVEYDDDLYAINCYSAPNSDGHLMTSNDSGTTWDQIDVDVGMTNLRSIHVTSEGSLLGSCLVDNTVGSLWRSTDKGLNWTNVLTLNNNSYIPTAGRMGDFVESDGVILIAEYGYVTTKTARNVYVSYDDGETWDDVWDSVDNGLGLISTGSSHIHAIWIDPIDYTWYVTWGDNVAGTYYGTMRSINSGYSWTNMSNVAIAGKAFTYILSDDDYVYFALDISPWGIVVKPHGAETYTVVASSLAITTTWNGFEYNGKTAWLSQNNDTCVTYLYYGFGDNETDWHYCANFTGAMWNSYGEAFNVVGSKIYMNLPWSNLWKVSIGQFFSEHETSLGSSGSFGSMSDTVIEFLPVIVTFTMLGIVVGYVKHVGS